MAGTATAQEAGPIDIEVPTVVTDTTGATDGGTSGPDDQLDLANVVQSAAKGVTTVQEAPVIVTVITADEIADRQFQTLDQILDTVPGYMRLGVLHSQFASVGVRGTVQAVQLLHDSVSMFDPFVNVATFHRLQPMETIKRIETITGPGGVLWGANSFLGVVNVITKDAEDVDGVEVGGQMGDGNGDRKNARVYVMAGLPDLMKGKAKLFLHTSFESYLGPGFQMPLHMFSAPLPQPNSVMFYGPLTTADPARSYLFNFFAKFTIGKVQLRVQAPLTERHQPMGFPGFVSRNNLPEDAVCDPTAPYDPVMDATDMCIDRLRTSRDNQINFLDRYVVAEYKSRTAGGKAGVNLKLYGVQFVRAFPQLGILSAVPGLLEGGLAFKFDATTYRTGGNFDGDFELPGNVRVNYGAEAFKEFAVRNVSRSIQGDGIEATFVGPYVLERLPLPCPREPFTDDGGMRGSRIIANCPLTFAFPSDRMVGGVYANPQWRPSKKLILDAGARLQVSPESLGTQHYPLTRIFSGTAVWNFIPSWHLKLNYAEGFRPPVYNNNSSNGEAVQLDGGDLEVETSQAVQAEINARIFKGQRRIRELSFRFDYSYTKLENLIQIVSGKYENTADRAMHGGEALAKLYIQGGHRIELSYTFLQVMMRDKGLHKSFPEHMFHLASIYNVIDDKLTMFTDLRVVGAMEDPNRLVEHRDYAFDPNNFIPGNVVNTVTDIAGPLRVGPTDLTLDRLPPAADLSLGFTLTPVEKLSIRGTVFNAFNARYYQPDAFYDYEPRLEMQANPWEDWRAYVSATYTH
ncbi:MAG TPA: TonB-dependent receptor [Kofleriaceae bacterium]|nr:TonB-dependent receptor [Kofleriaceae bacterium]